MATRSTSKSATSKSRASSRRTPPLEIGWREWAAFPELGGAASRTKAKIDTGAKTSAIHAFRVKEVVRDGVPYAEFFLHPAQKRKKPEIFCSAPIADRRLIRSSNGSVQERLVINTVLSMGARAWRIDLSLANRDEMGFRLLIGRDALRKKVIIHPGKSFLLGR
ncbi:MAG: RimK/LysX family protein [Pseudomonadota bacterium]